MLQHQVGAACPPALGELILVVTMAANGAVESSSVARSRSLSCSIAGTTLLSAAARCSVVDAVSF